MIENICDTGTSRVISTLYIYSMEGLIGLNTPMLPIQETQTILFWRTHGQYSVSYWNIVNEYPYPNSLALWKSVMPAYKI